MNYDMDQPSRRTCLRDPVPEIEEAKLLLIDAVAAHFAGRREEAKVLILRADIPSIREWTNSLWGKASAYVTYLPVEGSPPFASRENRAGDRKPMQDVRRRVIDRDGYHCRFCGIPVIRDEVRN